MQRLNTQSYRVLVGTPQSNCDGSKSSLDAELNVSETVSDTWGLSTTAANSVGIYRTGVEFGKTNWTETRGRAVTQNTKIKINPGQKVSRLLISFENIADRHPAGAICSISPV